MCENNTRLTADQINFNKGLNRLIGEMRSLMLFGVGFLFLLGGGICTESRSFGLSFSLLLTGVLICLLGVFAPGGRLPVENSDDRAEQARAEMEAGKPRH